MFLSLSKFKTTFQVPEAQPTNYIPFIHRSTKKKKKTHTHTLSVSGSNEPNPLRMNPNVMYTELAIRNSSWSSPSLISLAFDL